MQREDPVVLDVAVVVMRMVIGTSADTMVNVPPVTPTKPTVAAAQKPSVSTNAKSARNDR